MNKKRILFSGYAPVHFLCFSPVYRRLLETPDVEIYLSGGFRHGPKEARTYSLDGFYDPFDVDLGGVLPLEQVWEEDFDVLICSHLSSALFPRSATSKVQIFHGVSFKNLAVREKALRYDILCLPGQYHAERYVSSGLVQSDGPRCLVTGFAKADPLVSGTLQRDELLRRVGVDPELPTLLLAPTGEKYNALEIMGEEVIRRLAATKQYNILVKPHDHPKRSIDWFRELAPLESKRVRIVRDLDVIPYLHAADLLLTDASSVAVEFTLLDRPIVFLDSPKLFKRVQKRAPALDLDTYGRKIGVTVQKPAGVVEAVADCLQRPTRARAMRRAMARHVFHGPGGATERTLGVILYAAGLRPELPADVDEISTGSSKCPAEAV
jgi:hypothetical protein